MLKTPKDETHSAWNSDSGGFDFHLLYKTILFIFNSKLSLIIQINGKQRKKLVNLQSVLSFKTMRKTKVYLTTFYVFIAKRQVYSIQTKENTFSEFDSFDENIKGM